MNAMDIGQQMPGHAPLHPGPVRFAGGLAEVGPGIHAWLQPNGLLGESNAGLVVGDGASHDEPGRVQLTGEDAPCTTPATTARSS